nr:DUF4401 domain-containing protein [uncultured Fluviicola sp.]
MEKHKINLVERGKSMFPEATFKETKAEKETNYYGAHFGIRALEYLVFVGTLLTLGLFAGAVFQLMKNPSVGFYCLMAGILIGTTILLHLFVKQRLIDAMATGIGVFGIMSLDAAMFTSNWADKHVGLIDVVLILVLILISRKNLLTILGVVGILWSLNWVFDEYQAPFYTFKVVVMVFTLILAILIYLEEGVLMHFTKWSYFLNYLKDGFFVALTSYYVFGFIDWTRWISHRTEPAGYDIAMYIEILLLAFALFIWQYRRMKDQRVPLWLLVFLPLSLFLLGMFSVKIAFFLLAFLAFLFTRSIFGIVASALGLIYSVVYFYYELDWTLMHKSLLFMGLGALYLVLYFVLTAKKGSHE